MEHLTKMPQCGTAIMFGCGLAIILAGVTVGAEPTVKMEKISYDGWPNCIKLSNGQIELIATTDVGPRIIRFGYIDGQNLFKEYKDQLGKTGGNEWLAYGGHRLWHAPEDRTRTYHPDNSPVALERDGEVVRLVQPAEPATGIGKATCTYSLSATGVSTCYLSIALCQLL